MVVCGANKGAGTSNPEFRTVIITLEQHADVGLPTPTNRKEGEPGKPNDVKPEVAEESGGSVKVEISQPNSMKDSGTNIGSGKVTVNLTGMSSNLGIKVTNAGDGNTNFVLGKGVEESGSRYTLVQGAKRVNVPGYDVNRGHIQKTSLLRDKLWAADDKNVMGVRGMDQGDMKTKILRRYHAVSLKPFAGRKWLLVGTTIVTLGNVSERIPIHSEVIKVCPKGGKGPNSFRGNDSGTNKVLESWISIKPGANG